MNDLISRAQAIDAIRTCRVIYSGTFGKGLAMAEQRLRELPSAQAEPCEDAVSREAAIDVAENAFVRGLLASPDIRRLPSAQPEREKGEWTKDCACEICGFKPWYERDIHTLSFCPNCGADMRGEQDGKNT